VLKKNATIDADDLTVAHDLKTGKLVWKAVEKANGLNRYSGKRVQFHGTPVYFTGRVYCYDAKTGSKLWEEDTGSLVKPALALKEKLLRERNNLPGGEGMGAGSRRGARRAAVRRAGAGRGPARHGRSDRYNAVGSSRYDEPVPTPSPGRTRARSTPSSRRSSAGCA
jgi:hypothetical protein